MADDHAAPVPNTPTAPADSTPYIRTYAKDVARLTGTQTARSTPAKEAPTPGVQFAEIDVSQSQGNRKDAASPKEFPQEVISVGKDDTVENLNLASPDMKGERRDEILSRLRARVQPKPEEEVSVTSIPTLATPTPIVTPTEVPIPPVHVQPPAPVPPPPAPVPQPVTPVPVTEPVPTAPHHKGFSLFGHREPKAAPKPAEANLHTFKSDFADHIDEQKATTFSVLAAQSDVREARPNAPKPAVFTSKKSQLPVILTSIVLVIIGVGILGGAYWFVALRLPASATPFSVPSLIFADEKVELPANAPSLAQAIMQVAQQPSVKGNVVVTYITTTTNGKKGIIKSAQPGGPLIKQVFGGAPDILIRNITDASTAGVINAGTANAPFFILQVSSYERTFAGMLGWEPTMANDLSVFYPVATAASTSTAAKIITAPRFIDATVANHDVRILKDSANQTILIYGYRDKQTLIIAKDEAAFTALLIRLSAANGN